MKNMKESDKEETEKLYDHGRREYCVSESGEGSYQCPWCPCRFSNVSDLEAHYDAFGRDERTHKERWSNRLFSYRSSERDDEIE